MGYVVCKTCALALLFLAVSSATMDVVGIRSTESIIKGKESRVVTKNITQADQQKQYIIDRALRAGIKQETIDYVFKHIKYTPKVIKKDRKQPEFVFNFSNYMNMMVNEEKVAKAKKHYIKHRKTLDVIAHEYGIPPHYLIALWGLETDFGSVNPKFTLANSLYSMAMDNRRRDFFVKEFITALSIYEKYGIDITTTKSSWAGAFGHFQFIPSSFMDYATDHDKDGRPDIIASIPDAMASAANYLKKSGWKKGEKWGRPVVLPKNFDWNKYLENKEMTLSEWKKLGVKNFKHGKLPNSNIKARLLLPMGHKEIAFLIYRNFDVIYSWNHANFYVIAVGCLADRIISPDKIIFNSNKKSLPSFDDLKNLQKGLCSLGYYKGKIDGSFGSKTKRALIMFQKSAKIPPDGYPSKEVIDIVVKKVHTDKSFSCEQ